MEHALNLFDLFESERYPSSRVVYYDGTNKYSIRFDELHKDVYFVSELLQNLHALKSVICCLIKPSLSLSAIILG